MLLEDGTADGGVLDFCHLLDSFVWGVSVFSARCAACGYFVLDT